MPPRVHALTIKGTALLRVLTMPVKVAPPLLGPGKSPAKTRDCQAVWDTGATGTVVTQAVVDDLGLKPIGLVECHTANGSKQCSVYMVCLMLPNGINVDVRGTEGTLEGFDVLIGMDVITLGDFSITNLNGKTTMSFRIPSQHEIDFVRQAQAADVQSTDGKTLSKPGVAPPSSRYERRHPGKKQAPKRRGH